MWTQLIIKRDPRLGCSQKLPKGVIRSSICYREFEQTDKALGLAIIGRSSCPTYGLHKAFLQEQGTGPFSTILLALITVPDAARNSEHHRLDQLSDQIGAHMIVESDADNLPCPLAHP